MDFPVGEVRSLGGGAASPLWLQIKADVLGKPILTIAAEEPGCLGAAMLGAIAAGYYPTATDAVDAMVSTGRLYEPMLANRDVYDEAFARYCELYERLATFF